jgi:SPX domain protein involved in polyphosphate accumulation
MKYGKYLKNNQVGKWEVFYMDYKRLKKLVSDTVRESEKVFTEATKVLSLSPLPLLSTTT